VDLNRLSLPSAALAYAQKGLPIFPLKARGKRPLTPKGLHDASADLAIVEKWWRRWPEANIGLPVPSGYLVLDLDSEEAMHRFKAEDLVLPATVWAKTGRGRHLWYRLAGKVRNRVGILPGVDVRAVGGYVVAPPSVHPNGRLYTWEEPLQRSSTSDAPEWLVAMLREIRAPRGRTTSDWAAVIAEPVSKGSRNQTLAQVAGLLFRKLPAEVAAELAFCWASVKLQPRLTEREIFRTLDSIAKRELQRRGGGA